MSQLRFLCSHHKHSSKLFSRRRLLLATIYCCRSCLLHLTFLALHTRPKLPSTISCLIIQNRKKLSLSWVSGSPGSSSLG